MAPAAIGRRRPDRLNDDQALSVDDVDRRRLSPGNPVPTGSGENETTRTSDGFNQDAFSLSGGSPAKITTKSWATLQ
jgi:hypothetical protein